MNILPRLSGCFCCAVLLAGCVTDSAQKPNVAKLEQRAHSGDAAAQRLLGESFDFGRGVAQSYVEAAKWYQMAAEQGDAIAQNNLGSFYQHGLGVATNYNKAVELYRQSAEQGFAMAQSSLGYMYDLGLGVPKDEAAAASWYRRAAEQGYPEAMMNLGVSYVQGTGVAEDLSEAYMWLDMARFFTQSTQDMRTKWRIRGLLDNLKQHMTREQLADGERKAKEWYENYTKHQKS